MLSEKNSNKTFLICVLNSNPFVFDVIIHIAFDIPKTGI